MKYETWNEDMLAIMTLLEAGQIDSNEASLMRKDLDLLIA